MRKSLKRFLGHFLSDTPVAVARPSDFTRPAREPFKERLMRMATAEEKRCCSTWFRRRSRERVMRSCSNTVLKLLGRASVSPFFDAGVMVVSGRFRWLFRSHVVRTIDNNSYIPGKSVQARSPSSAMVCFCRRLIDVSFSKPPPCFRAQGCNKEVDAPSFISPANSNPVRLTESRRQNEALAPGDVLLGRGLFCWRLIGPISLVISDAPDWPVERFQTEQSTPSHGRSVPESPGREKCPPIVRATSRIQSPRRFFGQRILCRNNVSALAPFSQKVTKRLGTQF